MPRWLTRLLAIDWTPARLAGLAMLLFATALLQGWLADDHLHQWMMRAVDEGGPNAPNWPTDLFRFVDKHSVYVDPIEAYGGLPWWSDPEVKIAFLRPVSAATHRFDHMVAPGAAWFAHAHSWLWMGLAVFLSARTYRSIGLVGPALVLAGLFFAVEDAHAFATTWVANRSTWVAMVFALLAFELHRRARERGAPLGLAALVPFAVGLLAKESALVTLVWIGAWELHLHEDKLWAKALALMPALVVFVAWRWVYADMGYGTVGSGMYVDPGAEPLSFLGAVIERAPEMMLAQVLPVPIEFASATLALRVGILTISVVMVLALCWWMWPHYRQSAHLRFCVTATWLALIPVSAPPVSSRLIVFAGFSALAGFAIVIARELEALDDTTPSKLRRMTRFMLFVSLPLSAALTPVTPFGVALFGNTLYNATGEHAEARPECQGADLLIVNGNDVGVAGTALYAERWAQRAKQDPKLQAPRSIAALGPMMDVSAVSRRDARSLDIVVEAGWFRSDMDRLVVRVEASPQVGERRESFRFQANIVQSTADGRPQRVRFEFDEVLEHADYCWIANVEGRPSVFVPPPVGQTLVLEPSAPKP